jgi:predicted nucleic-acid-binding Zn-ribbon protein
MPKCEKCRNRMFVDRQYTTIDHVEIFCLTCGFRKFFNPPSSSRVGLWILQQEKLLVKNTITPLS